MLCERWRLVGPSASSFGGRRQTALMLRWLKTVVVSVQGKGVVVGASRQVGTRKTFHDRPRLVGVTVDASKGLDGIESGGPPLALVSSLAGARLLVRWCPACRWREPGLRLLHGTGEGEMSIRRSGSQALKVARGSAPR